MSSDGVPEVVGFCVDVTQVVVVVVVWFTAASVKLYCKVII